MDSDTYNNGGMQQGKRSSPPPHLGAFTLISNVFAVSVDIDFPTMEQGVLKVFTLFLLFPPSRFLL